MRGGLRMVVASATLAGLAAVAAVTGCTPQASGRTSALAPASPAAAPPARLALAVTGSTRALTAGSAADRALEVSRTLFASAPGAVLAGSTPADERAAAPLAARLHVPMLLAPAPADAAARVTLSGELQRLGVRWVTLVGSVSATLPPGVAVVPGGSVQAAPRPVPPSRTIAVLADPSGERAVAATAAAAGATVVDAGTDLSRSAALDAALRAHHDAPVLLVGSAFAHDPSTRDWAVRAARSGYELPGGGQRPLPDRRFVALYGAPGIPVLGVLGRQGVDATIRRVQDLAAQYRPLSPKPVVPMLEIITTLAAGSPGADGDYSSELPADSIRPYLDAAAKAHVSVVLDLQPGRSDFLTQAKHYQALLERPGVGLALDPEWRLGPSQKPLEQIGRVSAAEVNRTSAWLAGLVRDRGLPPKLFVLHEFRLTMLQDRTSIVSRPQLDLVIHVDGQGVQPDKQQTWAAVLRDPPAGLAGWGWKNFLKVDHPMLTPGQTMREVHPTPDLISYQ
ncbi:hypothetical protein QDR37_16115 [Amnibacterium sp. CER49]|uniref:hypothetical protein n=1 Tax=Amnibacterium sp. CER49 TaxID=3039161 RepID=UPI00244AA151|nr:hypothetical protein [Amnibacterium sp. CER49]MDH2445473.1 hypothetical protein [Amnibacterium sp. CER49]